jgi:hypothetical protein
MEQNRHPLLREQPGSVIAGGNCQGLFQVHSQSDGFGSSQTGSQNLYGCVGKDSYECTLCRQGASRHLRLARKQTMASSYKYFPEWEKNLYCFVI